MNSPHPGGDPLVKFLLILPVLVAASLASCSTSTTSSALRSNGGIPIYAFPSASAAPC